MEWNAEKCVSERTGRKRVSGLLVLLVCRVGNDRSLEQTKHVKSKSY